MLPDKGLMKGSKEQWILDKIFDLLIGFVIAIVMTHLGLPPLIKLLVIIAFASLKEIDDLEHEDLCVRRVFVGYTMVMIGGLLFEITNYIMI